LSRIVLPRVVYSRIVESRVIEVWNIEAWTIQASVIVTLVIETRGYRSALVGHVVVVDAIVSTLLSIESSLVNIGLVLQTVHQSVVRSWADGTLVGCLVYQVALVLSSLEILQVPLPLGFATVLSRGS
jgi:hypothetical protein